MKTLHQLSGMKMMMMTMLLLLITFDCHGDDDDDDELTLCWCPGGYYGNYDGCEHGKRVAVVCSRYGDGAQEQLGSIALKTGG